VVYSGPDHGFLFGLENMIALLKGIERDHGWDILGYHCYMFVWFNQASLFHKEKAIIALLIFIYKQLLLVKYYARPLSCN
jgi:hypothetical protein